MKTIQPKGFTTAMGWEAGFCCGGFFVGVESIPNVDSRKMTFKIGNTEISCWETAALKGYNLELDEFYFIECLGKKAMGKGKGWMFDVGQPEDPAELKKCTTKIVECFRQATNSQEEIPF